MARIKVGDRVRLVPEIAASHRTFKNSVVQALIKDGEGTVERIIEESYNNLYIRTPSGCLGYTMEHWCEVITSVEDHQKEARSRVRYLRIVD